jgi:hypothetical protein
MLRHVSGYRRLAFVAVCIVLVSFLLLVVRGALVMWRGAAACSGIEEVIEEAVQRPGLVWAVEPGCVPYPQCGRVARSGFVVFMSPRRACLYVDVDAGTVSCRESNSLSVVVASLGTHDDACRTVWGTARPRWDASALRDAGVIPWPE